MARVCGLLSALRVGATRRDADPCDRSKLRPHGTRGNYRFVRFLRRPACRRSVAAAEGDLDAPESSRRFWPATGRAGGLGATPATGRHQCSARPCRVDTSGKAARPNRGNKRGKKPHPVIRKLSIHACRSLISNCSRSTLAPSLPFFSSHCALACGHLIAA